MTRRSLPSALFVAALAVLAPPAKAQRTGSLRGTVTAAGVAVAGARVAIEIPPRVAIANETGRYTIRDVPVGHYDVLVTALGYKPWHRGVDVAAGQSATLNVAPGSPCEGGETRLEAPATRGRPSRQPGGNRRPRSRRSRAV